MWEKVGCGRCLIAIVGGLIISGGCATIDEEEMRRERVEHAVEDIELYHETAVKPERALSLNEALSLAAEHNFNVWLARQEKEIQDELLTGAYLKQLPKVDLSNEYSRSDRFHSTSSQSIITGTESLGNSYSTEKVTDSFGVEAAWNVLDFGVTYLRSCQQAKEVHIAENQLRRTRQKLALDVAVAYWNAQTTIEIARIAETIVDMIEMQLTTIKRQMDNNTLSKLDGIKAETSLLKHQRRLSGYAALAQQHKLELAHLIGVSLTSNFSLETVSFDSLDLSPVNASTALLEEYALENRPELYTKDLEEAITRDEAIATLVKMFPSPSIFFNYNNDQNKYLYHKDWTRVGVNVAWDIFSIPSKIYEKDALDKRARLFEKERMAMAVGILTQLHLSLIEFDQQRMQLEYAQEICHRDRSMMKIMTDGRAKGAGRNQELIEQKLQFLESRADYLTAYSNTQTAYMRIVAAVGADLNRKEGYDLSSLKTANQLRIERALQETPELLTICEDDELTDSFVYRMAIDQL